MPHGNPDSKGLLVRKSGNRGACNVPHSEFLLVVSYHVLTEATSMTDPFVCCCVNEPMMPRRPVMIPVRRPDIFDLREEVTSASVEAETKYYRTVQLGMEERVSGVLIDLSLFCSTFDSSSGFPSVQVSKTFGHGMAICVAPDDSVVDISTRPCRSRPQILPGAISARERLSSSRYETR